MKSGQACLSMLRHVLFMLCAVFASVQTMAAPSSLATGEAYNRLLIIYSGDSKLQTTLARLITEKTRQGQPGLSISASTTKEVATGQTGQPHLVVAIGKTAISSAQKHFPDTDTIFIAMSPESYRPDSKKSGSKAVLYMTPPVCRQLNLIKQIQPQWHTVSYLYSNRANALPELHQCAKKKGMTLYGVHVSNTKYLTEKLKEALTHSDVLLALPNRKIYNSKTVKNILLTSYRHRKPVIAFSGNFVNAGALASIHSNIEQIAGSASTIIRQYFDNRGHFEQNVYYPSNYEASVNRQVFKALGLKAPDLDASDSLKPAQ